MRTILIALLVSGCTPAVASSPDYVERHDEPTFDQPARIPETAHATRGEHVQLTPPPEPVYVPFDGAQCPEWHEIALQAGWEIEHLERLDYIIWRESRCQPNAHYKADPMTGSRGLTQVNGFWCLKNRWEPNPAGYLGAKGIITSCEDLFDPLMNLQSAKAIYDYGVERSQCPWRPWSTRNTKWCG
jgi:hypothetical protein